MMNTVNWKVKLIDILHVCAMFQAVDRDKGKKGKKGKSGKKKKKKSKSGKKGKKGKKEKDLTPDRYDKWHLGAISLRLMILHFKDIVNHIQKWMS